VEKALTRGLPQASGAQAAALAHLLATCDIPCEIVLPSGECVRAGSGAPVFRAIVHSERALRRLDEYSLACEIGRAHV